MKNVQPFSVDIIGSAKVNLESLPKYKGMTIIQCSECSNESGKYLAHCI